MKRTYRPFLEVLVIAAMASVVCVFGILQYRWNGEISGADQGRLKAELTAGVRTFNQEFSYDFERLGESFEIDPEEPTSTINPRLLDQYSAWMRGNSRQGLVANLYVSRNDKGHAPYVESLDSKKGEFRKAVLPKPLEALPPSLEKQFEQLPSSMSGHDATYYPWTFYGNGAPALVRPLFRITSEADDSDMQVEPIGFLIIQIDAEYLKGQYFPELVEHHFGSSSFMVAVRSASLPHEPIYESDPAFPISSSSPDAESNLFNSVAELAQRRGHPPVSPSDQARQWQLVAQHPAGSLEVAVAQWRRRNLAISIGLLAILVGSVVLIISVARRNERLGRFQMEFVAGVSHELCTPLAVVNSAVENLADGVVDRPEQIQEYAAILRDQSGRLGRLMDQVMLLAAGRLGRSESETHPVEVGVIVAQCVAASEPMLRDATFVVEKEIGHDLPTIMADPSALSSCLENLISNAMKYGVSKRWIAVRVRTARVRSREEVQISVEDRGIGISSADLRNIFEPFYRVESVRQGQIRGVGLGLYLVKSMIEQMGGRISVSSEVGRGSCFVLHFPVSSFVEQPQGAPAWSRTG